MVTVPLPSGRPAGTSRPTTSPPAPRWIRPAVAGSALVAAAALVLGVLEARLPVGPGNAATHHSYPFLALVVAAGLLTAGVLATRHGRRWAALATASAPATRSTRC